MRKAVEFAKKVVEWELTIVNIKPHLEEMPFIQPMATELEEVIVEGKTLDSAQEIARGQLQDAIHRRQEVEKRGQDLRRRIASHLKGSFGFASDDLVKFGVRPRQNGPRAPRTVKKPAPTTPE
jgi:hypothetical protein